MKERRTRGPRYIVEGRVALRGSVQISGAKNAALAAMCAGLLTDETITLKNVPQISDAESLADLIEALGATARRNDDGSFEICGRGVHTLDVPTELITENRASFQVLGPLLARHGYAASAPPGGDAIGQRPIDVHFFGFQAMGAEVDRHGERYVLRAPNGLHGARIFMDYPSVTGTQNVMMAAALAHGRSTIINAATEPEVQDLGRLLNAMGAKITGLGAQIVEIEGVEQLHGAELRIMPDRIEAGTFAIAAVMTDGELEIHDAPVFVMDAVITKLRAAGAEIEAGETTLHVRRGPGKIRAISFQALPYPGLPTDIHAPMAAMLTQAHGVSIIHERVFDNRMLYVGELRKLGAEIVTTGSSAILSGPAELHGAHVRALDVRAGAAVLLGALAADGKTVIEDVYHLDRGYERLDEKLRALGVEIERN